MHELSSILGIARDVSEAKRRQTRKKLPNLLSDAFAHPHEKKGPNIYLDFWLNFDKHIGWHSMSLPSDPFVLIDANYIR